MIWENYLQIGITMGHICDNENGVDANEKYDDEVSARAVDSHAFRLAAVFWCTAREQLSRQAITEIWNRTCDLTIYPANATIPMEFVVTANHDINHKSNAEEVEGKRHKKPIHL